MRAGRRRDRARPARRGARVRRCCAPRASTSRRSRRIASGAAIGSRPRLARGGGSTWQSLRRGTGSLETDYLNGEIALLGAAARRRQPRERVAADGRERRGPRGCSRRVVRRTCSTVDAAGVAAGRSGVLAADRDDLAGHVRREVAGEEDDHVRDLPRLGGAPERLAGLELGEQLLGRDLGEERVHRERRRDRVDAHVVRPRPRSRRSGSAP